MSRIDEELRAALEALEGDLVAAGNDVGRSLAPGRDPADVAARLEAAGLVATHSAVTWFSWHDGLRSGAHADLGVPYWWPMSLAEALVDVAAADVGDEPWQWKPQWLPIAWFGGMPRLALRCGSEPARSAVRYVAPDEGLFSDTDRPRYASLLELVERWRAAIAEGVIQRGPDGRWRVAEGMGATAWAAALA